MFVSFPVGGNSHTGRIRFINLEIAGMQRGISQHAFLNVRLASCFTVKYLRKKKDKRRDTGSVAGCYLELVSGTQQSTLHFHSSQTLRLDSGADTRPRFPAHGGRRGATGSHSDIDLLTGRPGIFPGTETRRHSAQAKPNPQMKTGLTLSVHVSTHLSTDMFWMTALKGRASVTLSGRRKQPLKMALPSERQR